MIQIVLVGLVFVGSLVYLGIVIYKQLQAKSACSSAGCGKCSVVDFNFKKIEAELVKKEIR